MKIVTFNLRCGWDEDGINEFRARFGFIVEKMVDEAPDVVCFQEVTERNLPFLQRALPEYGIVYNGRDADRRGEGLATAYRSKRVSLLSHDAFWTSDTPYVAGSRFPDQSFCPRVCQELVFKREDGYRFRVYNVHMDHISEDARVHQAQFLLPFIAKRESDAPLFLMGDFNTTREKASYALYRENLHDLTEEVGGTFHNYGRAETIYQIDFVFTNADGSSYRAYRWEDCSNGIYLSDHYPVCVEAEI